MLLNREHSKAQHSTAQSPLHNAANQVRADQSTYQNMYQVCTYMHAVSGLFSWTRSSWHLQVACLHLKCWTIYFITTSACHSNPCFFVSERSGRNRCTGIRTATAVQQQWGVRVCLLNREHIKAQHSSSAITPAQSKQRPSSC